MSFPSIKPADKTVTSLHAYSRILGTIRAAQSEPHPRWWHASLEITDWGLDTGDFPLGEGTIGRLRLDPADGVIGGVGIDGPFEVELSGPASEVGRRVLKNLGKTIDIDPDRWDAIEAQSVDQTEAASYLAVLIAVRDAFSEVRHGLAGEVGPIQLWPHHFDVAFEWFSDAVEIYEEEDGPKEYSKQIGFGFSPGDEGNPEPYFYANPWPFDESFRKIELPPEASWHTEAWSGGYLPYSAVVAGNPNTLSDFMRAVFTGTRDALS
ncbi:MAG: DUF5996 family protein [Acidimicrobiia bacterium]